MELVHGRDAAGPQGVFDNAWSSLRAAPNYGAGDATGGSGEAAKFKNSM